MEIEFQLSKNDYLRFYKLCIKDSFYKQFRRFVIVAIGLLILLNAFKFIWWWFLLSLAVVPATLFIIYYFAPLLIFSARLNKIITNTPSVLHQKWLKLVDDGLNSESDGKINTWQWQSMKSAYSNAEFVYIFLVDKKFIAIPKSSFKSESEAVNFYGLVLQKITAQGGMLRQPFSSIINKPNYWWGLLGLMPGIGAVAGIIFTVNGISRYKDTKYTLMGLACIGFTLGVGYFINNNSPFEQLLNKPFVLNSRNSLNTLMKSVEFYKLQHGEYPDSLAQLGNEDRMISEFDPIQSSANKYGTGFNYKKVGGHYYLFSSGLDGIPNTKDDFYPTVAVPDSDKFGLIIK
jgi:hypothetical protein